MKTEFNCQKVLDVHWENKIDAMEERLSSRLKNIEMRLSRLNHTSTSDATKVLKLKKYCLLSTKLRQFK